MNLKKAKDSAQLFWRYTVPMNVEMEHQLDAAMPTRHQGAEADGIAIRFANVQFSYPGCDQKLFENLSLDLPFGEFTAVIGGNGSGKSTFLKHINALLVPDSGVVEACGMNTADAKMRREIRKRVAMVTQNPGSQLLSPIVIDDVAFGPLNAGVDVDEALNRARAALEIVGISELAQAQTPSLSGGQAQLVALAGALAMEPQVLLLDEPTAMLDPRGHDRVMEVVERARHDGLTVVMATHNSEDAAQADRVLLFDAGKLEAAGCPEQVLLDDDLLVQNGLEPPFACVLAKKLSERGIRATQVLSDHELEEELCASFSKK